MDIIIDRIKFLYKQNKISGETLNVYVSKGIITQQQCTQIINEIKGETTK